jgi:hypothetical protein
MLTPLSCRFISPGSTWLPVAATGEACPEETARPGSFLFWIFKIKLKMNKLIFFNDSSTTSKSNQINHEKNNVFHIKA